MNEATHPPSASQATSDRALSFLRSFFILPFFCLGADLAPQATVVFVWSSNKCQQSLSLPLCCGRACDLRVVRMGGKSNNQKSLSMSSISTSPLLGAQHNPHTLICWCAALQHSARLASPNSSIVQFFALL
eukprot:c15690_g1_i1.p1 GENE.c15690_g1_i1~~c15690_g1_i1.p1  ORF type:complete len:131 (-),score=5.29 c15690_g1_i1:365-757(-)